MQLLLAPGGSKRMERLINRGETMLLKEYASRQHLAAHTEAALRVQRWLLRERESPSQESDETSTTSSNSFSISTTKISFWGQFGACFIYRAILRSIIHAQ